VTVGGRYISDPSTNTFMSNVTVTASGTLEGGYGDLFDFKKNLIINSTNNLGFNLRLSTVEFSAWATTPTQSRRRLRDEFLLLVGQLRLWPAQPWFGGR